MVRTNVNGGFPLSDIESLIDRFEWVAEHMPAAIAITDGYRQLSYDCLLKRARAVAAQLQVQGVQAACPVGLCSGRSLETVIGMLGILYMGGYYVPLDPAYPEQRLRFMLADTQLAAMVGRRHELHQLPRHHIWTLVLDGDVPPSPHNFHAHKTVCESVAYAMYTSGSTGRPKGVRVTHGGILRLVAERELYGVTQDDVVAMISAVAFDASTVEVWGALLNGGRLACYDNDSIDLDAMAVLLEREYVQVLMITVALFRILADRGMDRFHSLRLLWTGGEAVPVKQVQRAAAAMPNCQVTAAYGPTENATFTTVFPVFEPHKLTDHVPIGYPLNHTTCYVVDHKLTLVDAGEAGELVTGGMGLARDYLARPGLTAERFVPDPFSDVPGARLYHTGDLVYTMADGALAFVGRIDNQVKIRGFRIELGEIENALLAFEAVDAAAVMVDEGMAGEKRLLAYVVPHDQAALQEPSFADHIREELAKQLPDYMVPQAWLSLANFPVTANGKVDRKALPPIPRTNKSHAPAQTTTEQVLVDWYTKTFSCEGLGRDAQFLTLGGHSLLAAQLMAFVREKFAVTLSTRQIMASTDIATLAEVIDASTPAEVEKGLPILDRQSRQHWPTTFSQSRLLLEDLDQQSRHGNVITVLDLRGSLSPAILEQALNDLIATHEVLHTVFGFAAAGEPYQAIAPIWTCQLPVLDCRCLSSADSERVIYAWSQRYLDPRQLPLFYPVLLWTASERWSLVINIHHLLTDGHAQSLLLDDLATFYAEHMYGQAKDKVGAPPQSIEAAQWERNYHHAERVAARKAFWHKTMADAPDLHFPLDFPRPAQFDHRGARIRFQLTTDEQAAFEQLVNAAQVTRFACLLSLWSLVLMRYSRQWDVTLGVPVANRPHPSLNAIVTYLTNTTLMRARAKEPRQLLVDFLRQTQRQWLDVYDAADFPFDKLVDVLQPERLPGRHVLFQHLFGYFHHQQRVPFPGCQRIPSGFDRRIALFDTTLEFHEQETTLVGELTYATSLIAADTAERLVSHLRQMLCAAAQQINQPALRIAIAEWSDHHNIALPAKQEQEIEASLLTVLARWARQTPDSIAIHTPTTCVTYSRLAQDAANLGAQLRRNGVGPEQPVGVQLSRSPAWVTALLGTWYAGGIYVPLDPRLPAARRQQMAEEANLQTIITDGFGEDSPLVPHHIELVLGCTNPADVDNHTTERQQLAYLIFTSGSTGRPKAVAVVHHALMVHLTTLATTLHASSSDRVLSFAGLSFDVSLEQVGLSLYSGANLHLAASDWEPQTTTARCEQHALSIVNFPTAFWSAWCKQGSVPTCLDTVIVGGEAMPTTLAKAWPHGQTALLNAYGPTETVISPSMYPVTGEEVDTGWMTLGRPFPNRTAYVLDPWGQPVPRGAIGELFLGGQALARGYWSQPGRTAAVFRPHPHPSTPGERLYATGDLVRQQVDGNLAFMGRCDAQVKLRGFRIEPGEVEARLLELNGIYEAAVDLVDNPAGERSLVAWIAGTQRDSSQVEEQLTKVLPAYMVPTLIQTVDTLPKTASGKVDRRALPTPQWTAERTRASNQAPSAAEKLMIETWSRLFPDRSITRTDHFFHLGGHSLLAAKLRALVDDQFGIDVPLRTIFEHPRLCDYTDAVFQAMLLQMRQPAVSTSSDVLSDAQPVPLTLMQRRLWLHQKIHPQSTAYNSSRLLALEGIINMQALDRALQALIQHQPSLRTRFPEINSTEQQSSPYQDVLPTAHVGWQWHGSETEPMTLQQVREHSTAIAAEPFVLSEEIPCRWHAYVLGPESVCLFECRHHIVTDGWSEAILTDQLFEAYQGFCQGTQPSWPPLQTNMRELAAREAVAIESGRLQQSKDYWRNHLAGVPSLLDLPHDHPHPSEPSHRGDRLATGITGDLFWQCQAVAADLQITPFCLLSACLASLFTRYSAQSDWALAVPAANRGQAGADKLIGFFANTLPLRIQTARSTTFAQLAQNISQQTLTGFAHEHYPFDRIIEDMDIARQPGIMPLCQVLFALQEPQTLPTIANLNLSVADDGETNAVFDLALEFTNTPNSFSGQWTYAVDIFETDTIQRLNDHFLALTTRWLNQPHQPITRGDLLLTPERQAMLNRWQENRRPVAPDPIDHIIARKADEHPDRIAVATAENAITHQAMTARVQQLACQLRQRGIMAEARVAVIAQRSPNTLIAMLAIWRAGGVYVPIDPDYPDSRQDYMLADSQASLLLTDSHAPRTTNIETLAITTDPRLCPAQTLPARQDHPDAAAYLIYTSGSTGKPKGVAVPFRGLVNLAIAQQSVFDVHPGDRVLQFAALGFDAAISEMIVTLYAGATLILPSRSQRLPGPELAQFLVEQAIHSVTLPPSALAVIPPGHFPHLRTVITAGEACPANLARTWRKGRRYVNAYGPTEGTVCATMNRWDGQSTVPDMGPPQTNVLALVCDVNLQALPVGIAGELCIGGMGLARGYHGKPGQTARQFVPNPYGQSPGDRLYRTGDRVKEDQRGHFHFLGRIDKQVKLRGFRIELGEIAASLEQLDGIRASYVMVRRDQPGVSRLVAYVLADENRTHQWRDQLRRQLPAYMVPEHFVCLDDFPKTPNGKIDEKALPQPTQTRDPAIAITPAGVNPTEIALIAIWQSCLGRDNIGRDDNFFDLGGHSLLATQVMAEIQATFHVNLPVATLFENPVLQDLAAIIRNTNNREDRASHLQRVPRDQLLPLSSGQQRIWFFDQAAPGHPAYNVPHRFHVLGPFDARSLEQVWQAMVVRHEILRTRYAAKDGVPHQVPCSPTDFRLPVIDLTGLANRQWHTWQLAALAAQATFDLDQPQPWRWHLLRTDPQRVVLLLTLHHIATDGWSMERIFAEMLPAYAALVQDQSPQWSSVKLHYADYAHWQHQWLANEEARQQHRYWLDKLSAPLPLSRTQHPRPSQPDMRTLKVPFALDHETTQGILELAQAWQMTPFTLLLATFKVMRAIAFDNDDILTATPLANRNRPGLDSMLGIFVNTVVLRLRLDNHASLRDLADLVRQDLLATQRNQDYPFDRLVEQINPNRASHHPIAQVMFNYTQSAPSTPQWHGSRVNQAHGDFDLAIFDLVLNLQLIQGAASSHFSGMLQYQTVLFDSATAQQMADLFTDVLRTLHQSPDTPLLQLKRSTLVLQPPQFEVTEPKQSAKISDPMAEPPSLGETPAVKPLLTTNPDEPVAIGTGFQNYPCYIIDRDLNLMPIGVPGELVIAGESLSRGYIGDPVKTAQKFIPDPFSNDQAARMYKTGDLAAVDEHGVMRFIGRVDHQIKIRGYRVELGEIENAITQFAAIQQAVVVRYETAGEGAQLAAYYQCQQDQNMSAETLREGLAATIPDYMVPTAFMQLDKIPLTPNGKLNRKGLPKPQRQVSTKRRAPLDDIERTLVAIWQAILGSEAIGVEDNFFHLGGHSLMATRVTSAIRDQMDVQLPIRVLFESPTVAGLAEVIRSQRGETLPTTAPLRSAGDNRCLPLSYAQERLWFLDRFEGPSSTYNMPFAVGLHGPVHVEALDRALAALVARHEVLRAVYSDPGSGPRQVPRPCPPDVLTVVDLRHIAAPQRETLRGEIIQQDGSTPFHLETGPVFRFHLVRETDHQHALLTNTHHIAFDGWSAGIFNRELDALYRAFSAGAANPLPPTALQYGDYAAWQRQHLSADMLKHQLQYWCDHLADHPPPLDLPTDRPRPAERSFQAANLHREMCMPAGTGLRAMCEAQDCTLFMGLLAAFKVMLYRYTGQTDLCVGTPIAGRHHVGTETMVGMFLNTLVLRSRWNEDQVPDFASLLQDVRRTTLDAFSHQDVPFEQLLATLKPERDLSRTPLFQVFFNMVNLEQGERRLGPLTQTPLKLADIGSKFDLTLYAGATDRGLIFDLTFNTDLFDHQTMAFFLDQYVTLLDQVGQDASKPLWQYSLTTDACRRMLPNPRTDLDDTWHGGVHDWMRNQALRTPDRIAVVMDSRQLSYDCLRKKTEQVAALLVQHGIRHGDVVVIVGSRRLCLPLCIFATLQVGATFVMLDPAYPTGRLQELTELAAPRAVIELQNDPLPDAYAQTLQQSVQLARLSMTQLDAALNEQQSQQIPQVKVGPDDVAYIAFTSGSTGKPKGVAGRHGPLSHFLPWMNDAFEFGASDRFSMLSGIAHDPLQRDMFTPLASGGALAIPPESAFAPGRLAAWMAKMAITVSHLTPAMGQILADAVVPMPRLRRAFFVGEALTRRDLVRLRKLAPAVRCVNYYGTTETQRAVAFYPIDEHGLDHRGRPLDAAGLGQVLPLGNGIPDVQLLVLNHAGQQAAVGERGEIYLRSPHLAAGYRGDETLTNSRFVTNPFTRTTHDRLYRTGDLGRVGADGNVLFLGRADFQIKIRGFRVEPGDIEASLVAHPDIHEALVLARTRDQSGLYLTGYLVKAKGCECPASREDVRRFLKVRLPEYMVPTAFVWLDAWPLTPNKKIDRRALPEPDLHNLTTHAAHALPRTDLEQQLAHIWADVLSLPQVGLHDNFFELGGHSLLATQLLSRIHQELGISLSLRTLFQGPTLAELADALQQSEAEALEPGPVAIPRDGALPVSPAQQRLWFLQRLEPNNPAFNLILPYRIHGHLDCSALTQAYTHLLQRHEALRCTFPEQAGEPVAYLDQLPSEAYAIEHVDADSMDAVVAQIRDRAANTMDITCEPAIRALLFRLSDNDWVLCILIHHVVADGWSIGVLFADLSALYRAARNHEVADLPPLAIQYPDFAAWHRRYLAGPAKQRDLSFWQTTLAGAPPVLEIPPDLPRPAKPSGRGHVVQRVLPQDQQAKLHAVASAQKVTAFHVYLAAWQTLIYRYTGMADFVVGTPVANRNRPVLEPLVGCFINTLLLRTPHTEAGAFGEQPFNVYLQDVRDKTLAAFDHSELTFDQLVESLKPPRDLSRNPLFQVSFIYQSGVERSVDFPEMTLARVPMHGGTAQFDLTLTVLPGGNQTTILLEYATDLYHESTITGLAAHYAMLLDAVSKEPTQSLDRLPLMSETERKQLMQADFNQTETPFPRAQGLIHLLDAQVQAIPDRIAIADVQHQWTYAQLWQYAGEVAKNLAVHGVGLEHPVGVCMQRSNDMVGCLLGVLRAGATYVPMDPTFPEQRLHMIAEDAGMQVMIVDNTTESAWQNWPITILTADTFTGNDSEAQPLRFAGSQSLAYVIFTSGSTGRPKGVAVRQDSLVNFLTGMARDPGMAANDRLLAVTTVSFDIAGLEMYLPLTVGAMVQITRKEQAMDPEALANLLVEQAITVMQATPATWRMLYSQAWPGQPHLKVLAGGEALPQDLADRLTATCNSVWNVYGPTETTIWSTRAPVRHTKPVHIGQPMENTQIYVVDRLGYLVPRGVPGELLIGGTGLARGYWHRADLTAERFLPDPFGAYAGARLYRTGDLVRIRHDDQLQYLNRLDFQVKVRGFRIELGDIEAALQACPGVQDAAVIAQTHQGETQLAAFVVADEHLALEPLLTKLKEQLPPYMIPAALQQLTAMPRNTSGKLDRNALAAMDIQYHDGNVDHTPPRDGLEQKLCAWFAELLNLPQIGIHGGFFDHGGHSLLAVKLMSKMREHFDTNLPMTTLFQADTPAKLALELKQRQAGAGGSPLVTIQIRGDGAPLFMPHTVLGGVMGYRHLAPYLDHPIYAFESSGLYPGGQQPTSFVDMATQYIEVMRQIQPQGPHHLAGWSLGGITILEMAAQLQANGDPPASLQVIDTVPWLDVVDEIDLLRNFASVYAKLQQNFLSREELAPLSKDARFQHFFRKLNQTYPNHGLAEDVLFRGYHTYRANQMAVQQYRPRYTGHVMVYCCLERDPRPFVERWLASGIPHTMVQIPGNHETLMEPPNAEVLAHYLADYLKT